MISQSRARQVGVILCRTGVWGTSERFRWHEAVFAGRQFAAM